MSGFAGDLEAQGQAIVRLCRILRTACARIVDPEHPMRPFLDESKFEAVTIEARRLLPHFQACSSLWPR